MGARQRCVGPLIQLSRVREPRPQRGLDLITQSAWDRRSEQLGDLEKSRGERAPCVRVSSLMSPVGRSRAQDYKQH